MVYLSAATGRLMKVMLQRMLVVMMIAFWQLKGTMISAQSTMRAALTHFYR